MTPPRSGAAEAASGHGANGAPQRLLVVGLGLIGGSLVRAVRAAKVCRWVAGCESDAATRREAQASALFDELCAAPRELSEGVDLVVLAVPPAALADSFRALRDHFGAALPVLSDTTSFKYEVLQIAQSVFGAIPPQLVPAHPLAGSEKNGWRAASAQLLPGCRVILCPQEDTAPAAVAVVQSFWRRLGCVLLQLSAAEHDRLLGSFSHLPHLLAYGLMEALEALHPRDDAFAFSGPGLRDMTRLAASSPTLWRDIVLANRGAVLEALERYLSSLQQLRQALVAGDAAQLLANLERGAAARRRLEEQNPAAAGGA